MKRGDFLKAVVGGAVVAMVSPLILKASTIPIEIDALKPNCYQFKITRELYAQYIKEQPLVGILSPLHPLDKLCVELTGYPIKQIVFVDDDFAKNYYTIVSFRKEVEDEKALALS